MTDIVDPVLLCVVLSNPRCHQMIQMEAKAVNIEQSDF